MDHRKIIGGRGPIGLIHDTLSLVTKSFVAKMAVFFHNFLKSDCEQVRLSLVVYSFYDSEQF